MEEGKPQKILVAVGAYAPVNQAVYWNHIEFVMNELVHIPKGWRLGWHVWRRTPLTVFREDAARIAIENDFDWLFFLDDDLIIEMNHDISFFQRLVEHGKDFITTVVLHRGYPHIPMLFVEEEGDDGFCPLVDWPRDKLSEIDITHLACTLLSVPMLKKTKSEHEHLFDMHGEGSDDIRFCRRVRESTGLKPWLDPFIKTRHLGRHVWITEDVFKKSFMEFVKDGPDSKTLAKRLCKRGFRARAVKAHDLGSRESESSPT